MLTLVCAILFLGNVYAHSEKKKYPEGWIYEGKTLHPRCFKTNWQSGTKIISLDDCLSFADKSFGFVKGSVLADGDNGKGVDWYSVSEEISTKKCQRFASKNVSYIKGKCIESYSVSAGQYGYGTSSLSIFAVYGIFEMENGEKKIVPVKRY